MNDKRLFDYLDIFAGHYEWCTQKNGVFIPKEGAPDHVAEAIKKYNEIKKRHKEKGFIA